MTRRSTRTPRPRCTERAHGPSATATKLLACLSICLLAGAAPASAQSGESTFGHSRARELAELGRLPHAHDVVVRDLVNYHRHRLPVPGPDAAVSLEVRSDRGGAEPGGAFWLQVGYATAPEGDRALAEPVALALVIDCSGSMNERGKISRVQQGLEALVARLRPDDRIALIAFSDDAHVVRPLGARGGGSELQAAIATLRAGGGTNLHAGLMLGVHTLLQADLGDGSRRVVLLTDGIANRGECDPATIARTASERCGDTIDVSTIGVGTDLDTALLQRLARATDGLFHFVADDADIAKVFVHEADSLLTPVARDVRLSLSLPTTRGLSVPGHEFTTEHDLRVEVRLPDLNAGVTGVVMLRGRLPESFRGAEGPVRVPATLRFRRADDGEPRVLRADATLSIHERGSAGRADLLVRKNASIAVLAEGLHEMARACDRRCWSDANRALQAARAEADALFPGDDPDVQRVREITAGHARTLRRHLDRFRDF